MLWLIGLFESKNRGSNTFSSQLVTYRPFSNVPLDLYPDTQKVPFWCQCQTYEAIPDARPFGVPIAAIAWLVPPCLLP